MERVLEPEVMDTPEEAIEYDAMDFAEVNTAFAQRTLELASTLTAAKVLDLGTGTVRIPILIAQVRPDWQIIATDLAQSMLAIGANHIAKAQLEKQIHLALVDAKHLPYDDNQFDGVISNSLVHHLPDPLPFFQEIKRVLRPQGFIFLRDLLRPPSEMALNEMLAAIGKDYNEHQAQLFSDSLRAAFTLEEIIHLMELVKLEGVRVYQSSDRHWTLERSYSGLT